MKKIPKNQGLHLMRDRLAEISTAVFQGPGDLWKLTGSEHLKSLGQLVLKGSAKISTASPAIICYAGITLWQ
ncbi:hypothetical protein ACFOG5_06895 [Pedobacter fastidiosus]|uniref:Uncharacterized protein n=1 Tax=Pedobacter fastidiosus TaxID=2765361 RepID=A0ABR7KVX8_9SPHI|nr:hypothetical protein [Pedobacter fastidiosus]MBC6112074.1 hypothetical protein [Pedobacter fastidiosus]